MTKKFSVKGNKNRLGKSRLLNLRLKDLRRYSRTLILENIYVYHYLKYCCSGNENGIHVYYVSYIDCGKLC